MDEASALEIAIQIALNAHRGQKDKVGMPYILHPLRVMDAVRPHGYRAMLVAVLHDVVEDSTITVDLIKDALKGWYVDDVVEAVRVITKKKGEDYSTYLEKVNKNGLARVVKIADMQDNLNRMVPELKDLETRYRKGLHCLGAK